MTLRNPPEHTDSHPQGGFGAPIRPEPKTPAPPPIRQPQPGAIPVDIADLGMILRDGAAKCEMPLRQQADQLAIALNAAMFWGTGVINIYGDGNGNWRLEHVPPLEWEFPFNKPAAQTVPALHAQQAADAIKLRDLDALTDDGTLD